MPRPALPQELRSPSRRVLRQFGAAAALGCLAFGLAHAGSPLVLGAALGASALVGLLTFLVPGVLRGPFVVLSCVTYPFGLLVQWTLAAAFYFLVFTPLALLLRAHRRVASRGELRPSDTREGFRDSPPADPLEQYFRPY